MRSNFDLLPYFHNFVDCFADERTGRQTGGKDEEPVSPALTLRFLNSPELESSAFFSNPVRTGPGQRAVTVIPDFLSSTASASENERTNALLA